MGEQLYGGVFEAIEKDNVKDPYYAGLPPLKRLEYWDKGLLPSIVDGYDKLDSAGRTKYLQKTVFPTLGIPTPDKITPTQTGDIVDVLPGLFSGAAETGSYFTQPFEQALGTGMQRYNATNRPEYQTNPYYKAGADIGRLGSQFASAGLATASAGLAGLGAIPAAITGVGLTSGNENLQRFMGGEQNLGQSVFNTALDTALGSYAPKAASLFGAVAKNAGLGAAGAGAGYLGNAVLTGTPIQWQDILNALKEGAMTGGAIGGGVAAAHGKPFFPAKAQPAPQQTQLRPIQRNLPAKGQLKQTASYPADPMAGQFAQATKRNIKQIQGRVSVNADKTAMEQKRQLVGLYNKLRTVAESPNTPQATRVIAQRRMIQAQQRFQQMEATQQQAKATQKADVQRQRQEAKAQEKQAKQQREQEIIQQRRKRMDKAVELGVKAVKEGPAQAARFNNFLTRKFTPQDRALIKGKVKEVVNQGKAQAKATRQEAKQKTEPSKSEVKRMRKQVDRFLDEKNAPPPEPTPEKEPPKALVMKMRKAVEKYLDEKSAAPVSEKQNPKLLKGYIESKIKRPLKRDELSVLQKEYNRVFDAKAQVDSPVINELNEVQLARFKVAVENLTRKNKRNLTKAEQQQVYNKLFGAVDKKGRTTYRSPQMKQQSDSEILDVFEKAKSEKQLVGLEIEFERTGESVNAPYRFRDVHVLGTKQKQGQTAIQVINDDTGQYREYYLNDVDQGSRIVSAELNPKATPKHTYRKLDDGNYQVFDEKGNQVKQKPVEAVKSSEIRGKIEQASKIEQLEGKIKNKSKTTVKEVLDTAEDAEIDSIMNMLDSAPESFRKQLHKRITGKDC